MANPHPVGPRWKKGESGNPAGRRKDTFGPMVREFLDGFEELAQGEREQRGTLLIKKLFHMSIKDGNVRAITELLNRGYGLPTQRIDIDLDATEREIERIAAAHGKSVEDVRKRAAQRGMGLVS